MSFKLGVLRSHNDITASLIQEINSNYVEIDYIYGRAAEKGDLRTYANREEPDQSAHPYQPTQFRDHVEDIGLNAKILTRCVAVQNRLIYALRVFFVSLWPIFI